MPSAKEQLAARLRKLAADALEAAAELQKFEHAAPWAQFAYPLASTANTITLVAADVEATPEPAKH
jgi:hypothetical protein